MENCECKNWARDNIMLLTEHHTNCPKYNVEAEAKAHIEALLRGIIIWANDEDGVHYQCFDAFRSAAFFIGKPELVKAETYKPASAADKPLTGALARKEAT